MSKLEAIELLGKLSVPELLDFLLKSLDLIHSQLPGVLEEERRRLQQERMQLEDAQMAAGADSTAGAIEEEWLALVGEDNVAAIYALVGCEHPRAYLLAEAGKLSLNPDHQLAAHWIEAVIAADARDTGRAESIYPSLVEMDPDIDSVQQASIETDKAVLEVRSERRAYEITCDR